MNPIGATPWGGGPLSGGDVEQSIVESMGPAANTIMNFLMELEQAIVAGLADAEQRIEAVGEDIRSAIALQMVPAIGAVNNVANAARSTIQGHLADAAASLTAVTGEPVLLSDAMNTPLPVPGPTMSPGIEGMGPQMGTIQPGTPPGRNPGSAPTLPPLGPTPGPHQPHGPYNPPNNPGPIVKPQPPHSAPPVSPSPPVPYKPYMPISPIRTSPSGLPQTVPNAPGLPGNRWAGTSAPGPVASMTPVPTASTSPADTSSLPTPLLASMGLIPTPATTPPSGGQPGSVPGGSMLGPQSTSWPPPPPEGWERCPIEPSQPPEVCQGLTGDTLTACMFSIGYWCPVPNSTPTPSPTPTTPTPTTPTPTPTGPTGPTPTPTGPTPISPTPTPTPPIPPPPPLPPISPTPTPTPTPCQPPPGGPSSVGLGPAPWGWAWTWDQSSCSYYLNPVPMPVPSPEPTPTPTSPPSPTPTPTPVDVTVNTSTCGTSRSNPCFVASTSPDSPYPHFNVQSGVIDDLNKEGDTTLKIDTTAMLGLQVNMGLQDNADNPQMCSQPYMMSLVTAGTGLEGLLADGLTLDQILGSGLKNVKRAKGMWFMTIVGSIFQAVDIIARVLGQAADKLLETIGGVNSQLTAIAKQDYLFNILNTICMGALRKHKRVIEYSGNLQYPIGLPTPGEAASAWLGNEIDECTFQAYTQAGDYRYPPFRAVAMAGKFKFSALELWTLNKRNAISRDDINTRLREVGSMYTSDSTELDALFSQIPGPADIIRFMVRDTANVDTVNQFHMDDNFDENYQGDLKKWAQQQGVADEVMQHEWRAHWSIPSPTQLYEILHRLRHDQSYSANHDVAGDVREALIQQDILPYWIDALLAISYHPLTRTDLNRAYDHGWITDDKYVDGMYQNGYSDDDAQTLLKFARQERALSLRNSDFGRMWIEGEISTSQRDGLAIEEGYDSSVVAELDDILENHRDMNLQRKVLHALISQYKKCVISDEELEQEAERWGIPEEILQWQLRWAGEASTCGTRREMVGSLGQALEQGLITGDQYVARMKKLRFDDDSIQTYLALVQNKIARDQARAAAKAAKEQAKEQAAEQRAEEKAEKQAEQQAQRLAKQLASAERSRQARNKVLETSASLVEQYVTDSNGNAAAIVAGLYSVLQTELGLSQNESAHVIAAVASRKQSMTSSDFSAEVMEVGKASLANPWVLFPVFQPSPNGL